MRPLSRLETMRPRRTSSERGQAGIETIPFGVLVFVGGMLLVVNVWSILDARMTVDSAARDYLRAYTNSRNANEGRAAGDRAVRATVAARGRRGDELSVHAPSEAFGPCHPATVTVTLSLPAVRIPFLGSLGATDVSSTESELIAPYGSAEGAPLHGTVCDA